MKTIKCGIIGAGLMGKEFASAVLRWPHLTSAPARPEIVAVCNRSDKPFEWFRNALPTVRQFTSDYRELLDNREMEAVYIALPHHLHAEVYVAAIEAGKHVMGEKPFGIDARANAAILAAARNRPGVFVRCVSQFPFFPAVQRIGKLLDGGAFGRIIEVRTGFLHSSDLDPNKAINWKRQIAFNGAYGVMGDLGMHACHVPLRAGWRPRSVHAVLNNIVTERPDGKGGMAPCETWDNATLLIDAINPRGGETFPWTLRTARIAPGEKNTWYVEILGTRTSVRFSTANPKILELLEYAPGSEQAWKQVQTGSETAYPTITGGIFEFGFTDAILQMWAAFVHELVNGSVPAPFAGCVTPDEVAITHRLFTAALESQANSSTVAVGD